MTEEQDPRLELPGATTPPVEGRRWLWVKSAVWGAALLLMIAAAWAGAWVLTSVRVRIDLPPPREASRPETLPREAPSPGASAASAPAMREGGRTVVNPVWLQPPRPEFPTAAQRAGAESGMARLECQTRADGRVRACRIVEEAPTGVGFGEAAMRATMKARVQPPLVDGAPTEGQVVFTTRYRLD